MGRFIRILTEDFHMSVFDSPSERRRFVGAALLGGMLIALAFVAISWTQLLVDGRVPTGTDRVALGIAGGWVMAALSQVPFLLAVLLVVATATPRTVAVGAFVVYVVNLLRTLVNALAVPAPLELTVFAVPLSSVVNFLGVATAVWFAFHGGYERLAAAVGDVDQHPLWANFAERRLGPGLSLQRGLVVAGLASFVAAAGFVLANAVGKFFRAVANADSARGTTVEFSRGGVWNVGIPLAEFPTEWLFTASFLLAVLLVTGSRTAPRDVLKGLAVIYGVQSGVKLLPALVPPFQPVDLWSPSGVVMGPTADAMLFLGIAVAVWLAFHGGLERVRAVARSKPLAE